MKHQIYPASKVCLKCEGECCLRLPGPYHPSDFPKPITVKYLFELLENHTVVIDWRKNKGRATYYLRPPCSSDNGHFLRLDWATGSCSFHTKAGCSLPVERRPLGCRNLKPSSDMSCKSTFRQYEAFRSWARHRKLLEEVMAIVERRKKGDFSN